MKKINNTIKSILKQASENIDLWYWGYFFQGAVILGLLPILLPILIEGLSHSSAQAGWIIAIFYLGMLPAPLIGFLAEKTRNYAVFYIGGYLFIGIGCAILPFYHTFAYWAMATFIQGLGAGAVNTLAAMYIINFRPKNSWDLRIGWLQTVNGTGQAIGIGIASLTQAFPDWGLWICALLMIPGIILGRLHLPKAKKSDSKSKQPPQDHKKFPHHRHHQSIGISHTLHYYQSLEMIHFKKFITSIMSPFGLFMLSWFLTMFGMWMVMNLLPLLFKRVYGVAPWLSSLYYALAATVGIFFYAPSGSWGAKFGNAKVLLGGMIALTISLALLAILALFPVSMFTYILAPIAFSIIPVAWSPLIVAGTGLSGDITTIGQGPGIGLFNAILAIAAVSSAIAAGEIADAFNYNYVAIIAAIIATIGSIIFIPLALKSYNQNLE